MIYPIRKWIDCELRMLSSQHGVILAFCTKRENNGDRLALGIS